MAKRLRRVKIPTRNLTGISIRAIVESGDTTTACQIMEWLRVRGYDYKATMQAIRETAENEGYDLDPAEWDQMLG